MSDTLRELGRRAAAVEPPVIDAAGVMERGLARRRRRRGALAVAAASVLAGAVAAGVAITGDQVRPVAPLDGRTPSPSGPTDPTPPTSGPARPLTYTDDYVDDFRAGQGPRWLIKSIGYGDRVLVPGFDVLHMDLTDDGLVLVAADGGIYFSDGTSTEPIGELAVADGMSWSDRGVVTSEVGSLVAWFSPGRERSSVVVYDTAQDGIVLQERVPGCREDACWLRALVGNRVYVESFRDPASRDFDLRLRALDVPEGALTDVDEGQLQDDLRLHPRALVKGAYDDGEVAAREALFVPRGSALELRRQIRMTGPDIDGDGEGDGEEVVGLGGFDTLGRRLDLRLPNDYEAADVYALFQWLDDDRFAVMAGAVFTGGTWNEFDGYGDILVCDIPRGRCSLAAEGPADGFRLVPHVDAPN